MNLVFDEASHRYTLDGKPLPSVTKIIHSVLNPNAAFAPGSAERGKAVHLACQLHDEDDLDETSLSPKIAGYLEGWKAFLAEFGCVVHKIEMPVYSTVYLYAGTLDRIVSFPDNDKTGLAVLDIKSGVVTPETGLQTAAYALAYHEMTGILPTKRMAIHLKEDGGYRAQAYDNREDYNDFLSCLRVFRWRQRHKGDD